MIDMAKVLIALHAGTRKFELCIDHCNRCTTIDCIWGPFDHHTIVHKRYHGAEVASRPLSDELSAMAAQLESNKPVPLPAR